MTGRLKVEPAFKLAKKASHLLALAEPCYAIVHIFRFQVCLEAPLLMKPRTQARACYGVEPRVYPVAQVVTPFLSCSCRPTTDPTSTAAVLLCVPTTRKRKEAEKPKPGTAVVNGGGEEKTGAAPQTEQEEPRKKRRKVGEGAEANEGAGESKEEEVRGGTEVGSIESGDTAGEEGQNVTKQEEAAREQSERAPAASERNGAMGSEKKPRTSGAAGAEAGVGAGGKLGSKTGAPVFSQRRKSGPPPFPPSYYVLTKSELRENEYPAVIPGDPPTCPTGKLPDRMMHSRTLLWRWVGG